MMIAVLRRDFTGFRYHEGEFANSGFSSYIQDLFSTAAALTAAAPFSAARHPKSFVTLDLTQNPVPPPATWCMFYGLCLALLPVPDYGNAHLRCNAPSAPLKGSAP